MDKLKINEFLERKPKSRCLTPQEKRDLILAGKPVPTDIFDGYEKPILRKDKVALKPKKEKEREL